jgi:hypothetical protein
MTVVRDSAPLHLSGTAFQAVVGDASGPAPGEMWENQLAESSISCWQFQNVVQLSKLGFPTSNPSPVVNSLNHGLEAPCHAVRGDVPCFLCLHEEARNSAQSSTACGLQLINPTGSRLMF